MNRKKVTIKIWISENLWDSVKSLWISETVTDSNLERNLTSPRDSKDRSSLNMQLKMELQ